MEEEEDFEEEIITEETNLKKIISKSYSCDFFGCEKFYKHRQSLNTHKLNCSYKNMSGNNSNTRNTNNSNKSVMITVDTPSNKKQKTEEVLLPAQTPNDRARELSEFINTSRAAMLTIAKSFSLTVSDDQIIQQLADQVERRSDFINAKFLLAMTNHFNQKQISESAESKRDTDALKELREELNLRDEHKALLSFCKNKANDEDLQEEIKFANYYLQYIKFIQQHRMDPSLENNNRIAKILQLVKEKQAKNSANTQNDDFNDFSDEEKDKINNNNNSQPESRNDA
jgi:hypothetical protein